MATRGRVLHRDKLVARGLALIMAVSFVFFLAASIAYAMGWGKDINVVSRALTFLLTPLFPFVLLTRTVVRTAVTTEEVVVEWGLWGPRIALGSITNVEVVTAADVKTKAGLLVSTTAVKGQTGYELYCPGTLTEAVWLEWTDEKGPHRAVVGASDPKTLARAIQEARATRLRVADPARAEVEQEAEAEAEAAAEGRAKG